MHFKISIILCFITIFNFDSVSQEIPVGSWRHHADYSDVKAIQLVRNKLFCSSSQGLFYYDLEDESINTLSSVDGLSGIQPTSLTTNPKNGDLIVGYKNGAVDFISENLTFTSFLDIETSSIYTNKEINAFTISDDILYIATDFGVVLLSLAQKQIIDTYENLDVDGSNLSIKHLYLSDSLLYLSTESGLLKGLINNTLNLKDFKNWDRYIISDTTTISQSLIYNNSLYCRTTDHEVYHLNSNNSWTKILNSTEPITSLFIDEGVLKCSAGKQILELIDTQFSVTTTLNQGGIIQDFVRINNQVYIAHNTQSLAAKSGNDLIENYRPGGPMGIASKIIQIEGYTLFLPEQKEGFSYFENGRWRTTIKTKEDNLLPIFTDASLDLTSGNVLFLSPNEGIYSWDTREITPLPISNTDLLVEWRLLSTAPDGTVWALVKTSNNLAFLNSKTSELLISNINNNIAINDYLIASNGDHYLSTNNGLVVFNIEESTSRILTNSVGNGNLPSNKITDLSVDLSGNIWIGTQNGICYLSNYTSVSSGGDVNATIPIFEGFFLFQGININSIQIDGGNRLWIGNRDGLWVFDENIQQNIMRFTTNNSPLRVNTIDQHIINPLNGEVFMLNQGQLLSHRSASSRAKKNLDEVKIFPNPVSLTRDTRMSIDGLTNNMEVMITDLAGNLIYKNIANGGTFSWELSNYSGFKIKPGIYLIFSVDNFGDKSYKGKFVVTK